MIDRNDQRSVIPFLRQPPQVEPTLKNFLNDVRQHIQDHIGNTTAPGQVGGVVLVDAGFAVKLTWNSVFNAHTYRIYRGLTRELNDAQIVGVVLAPQRVYYDGIDAAGDLFYWVRALNSLSHEGPISAMSTITV